MVFTKSPAIRASSLLVILVLAGPSCNGGGGTGTEPGTDMVSEDVPVEVPDLAQEVAATDIPTDMPPDTSPDFFSDTPIDTPVDVCAPDCDGKECGDDGCGGLCGACDDGNECTVGDACEEGVCVGPDEKDCNDGDVCTDDSCDPDQGCVQVFNTDPCDDLNMCTENDTCAGGVCMPGSSVVCDDGDVCTDDSCDPDSGCVNLFNTTPCDDVDPEDWYFPPIDPQDDTWEAIPPEALGWDPAKLQDLLLYLGQNNTTAVVLLYKGRILAEQYCPEWDPHTTAKVFSVSKSVTAFLVGRAQAQGLLDIDEYVTTYLPENWSYALPIFKSMITVRHLLTMTSGLKNNILLTFDAQAGTVWKYNTLAFKKLIAVLEAVTGVGIDEYTATVLYAPTGMRDTSWQQDKLYCSARDMARFGLMILAGGQWDGQTLLDDPDYFAAMLDSSQDLNAAYGYLWWLNGKESWVLPDDTTGAGSIIPSAPNDLVSAQGLGDKKIYVVPSMHLVLVRHGTAAGETSEEAPSGFDDTLWQLLIAAAPAPPDSP